MSREITPGGYWSHTLSSTMKRCDRQLYYGVYGTWEGWLRDGGGVPRRLYRAKKAHGPESWVGTLVHACIARLLRHLRKGAPMIRDVAELLCRVEELIREGFTYSSAGLYKQLVNPKYATCIMLHDLAGEDLHDHVVEGAVERGRKCMTVFLERYLPELESHGTESWELVDSLDAVVHDGFKLFMSPDLVVRAADGVLEVIDWKTGRGTDIGQIVAYMLYLQMRSRARGVELDATTLEGRSISLLTGEEAVVTDVTQQMLDDKLAEIDADIAWLRELAPAGESFDRHAFPKTPHKGFCEGCRFQLHCDTED